MGLQNTLSGVVEDVIAAVIMVVLAVLSFFFVVYVVQAGSGIAGVQAGAGDIVLSAAIIVAAAILAGVNY